MKSLRDHRTFSKFIENLHEGIYITSWDGTILDANPAFLRVFRVNTIHEVQLYRAGELLVDPRQRRRELEILGREGWVRDFELQIRRPDGEVRTVLDTAYSVTDPSSGETLFHGLMIDISRRKQLESRLREQAIRDELTGAYNRRYLAELEDNSEAKHPQAVVIANVQEFRRFNVLHGHQAGDEALVTVSRLLAQEIQAEDVLVRLGSDEFLLLLSDSDETGTEELSPPPATKHLFTGPGGDPSRLGGPNSQRTAGAHHRPRVGTATCDRVQRIHRLDRGPSVSRLATQNRVSSRTRSKIVRSELRSDGVAARTRIGTRPGPRMPATGPGRWPCTSL